MSKQDTENHNEISFWKPITLDELIEIQKVKPIKNLDELSELWPTDDNPDELYEFIIEEREDRKL